MRDRTLEPPAAIATVDGLAYSLWLPDAEPRAGIVILHGAGSCKESHHDFARACRAAGFAAVAFDQRGHGASAGKLDGRALEDVATVAAVLPPGARVLRGSSMGGYLAICAAPLLDAAAVVAICPAGAEHLLRALRAGRFEFPADRAGLAALIESLDPLAIVPRLGARLLLLHAAGDEQIPVEHSRALHAAAPGSRLIVPPGGHHRSVQHDAELQGEALRFVDRALARRAAG